MKRTRNLVVCNLILWKDLCETIECSVFLNLRKVLRNYLNNFDGDASGKVFKRLLDERKRIGILKTTGHSDLSMPNQPTLLCLVEGGVELNFFRKKHLGVTPPSRYNGWEISSCGISLHGIKLFHVFHDKILIANFCFIPSESLSRKESSVVRNFWESETLLTTV